MSKLAPAAAKQTPAATKQKLAEILDSQWLNYLYDRWQDEQQYEDPAEYGKNFETNTGYKVTRVKRRPLSFVFEVPEMPGALYEVQCTRNNNRWRRLS